MKSLSARLAVAAIVLTGFSASTVISRAATHKVPTATVAMGTTPMCMCRPSDPSHCGLD